MDQFRVGLSPRQFLNMWGMFNPELIREDDKSESYQRMSLGTTNRPTTAQIPTANVYHIPI